MNILVKIVISTIIGICLSSCQFRFNPSSTGNSVIETQERIIEKKFTAVKVSKGLEVLLPQSNENLIDIIASKISKGVLIISATENIKNSSSKKVMFNFKGLSQTT